MDRRSFFKSIFGGLAGAVGICILPKEEIGRKTTGKSVLSDEEWKQQTLLAFKPNKFQMELGKDFPKTDSKRFTVVKSRHIGQLYYYELIKGQQWTDAEKGQFHTTITTA